MSIQFVLLCLIIRQQDQTSMDQKLRVEIKFKLCNAKAILQKKPVSNLQTQP